MRLLKTIFAYVSGWTFAAFGTLVAAIERRLRSDRQDDSEDAGRETIFHICVLVTTDVHGAVPRGAEHAGRYIRRCYQAARAKG